MTTVDGALAKAGDDRPANAPAGHRLAAFEQRLEWAGEYLNPILVKETRQAIKSRQFLATFALLLLCVWVWSIYGIAWLRLTPSYTSGGQELFYGYFVILAFPLLVVVPFSAFRSLAAEREDRTYELLSITSLRPRQIIGGKLGSAVLQIMLFLSAVAPCLAFTYILRGIDILTILMMIGYLFFASLGFSLIGLLVATLATQRYIQTIFSVALIVGQFLAFWGCLELADEVLQFPLPFQDWEFWVVHAVGATVYVGYFALFYLAAAAQLAFLSDNRSTPLRIVMVLQFAAIVGWMSTMLTLGPMSPGNHGEWGMALVTLAGVHWAVMGMFMVGESPAISPRVRRGLPKSFLGRVFFTWFNPGPATGYLLAVSGVVAASLFAVAALWVSASVRSQFGLVELFLSRDAASTYATAIWEVAIYSIGLVSYVVIYLGLGKLIVAYLRKWSPDGIALPFASNVLLVLIGTGLPFLILISLDHPRVDDYNLLQATNPFWTLVELAENRGGFGDTEAVLLILVPSALVVFLFNLQSIFNEIRLIRVRKPERVLEDDKQSQNASHADRSQPDSAMFQETPSD